jgi:Tfp pilus assembly protein PilO
MKLDKRVMYGVGAGALALVGGLGWLIWSEYTGIEEARNEVATLRTQLDSGRKLLTGTPALEKDVIVLRETEAAIKEILPDDKDLYNLHRDLQGFCESTEVRITSIKRKESAAARKKDPETFEKVTYELTLEGDAFQVLAFLDRVEGHTRFLRIPTINWTASGEKAIQTQGRAAHRVKLELETFVYQPQGGPEPTKIEGYARKRELLLGEISKHRDAVAVEHYSYRGQRGRRDPWVDPRVPVDQSGVTTMPVAEQTELVDQIVEKADQIAHLWGESNRPDVLYVEQVRLRAELETRLNEIEADLRKLSSDNVITYQVAQSRLLREAIEPMAAVRRGLIARTGQSGPPVETLRTLLADMQGYIDSGKPKLALESFATIELQLPLAQHDPVRKGLAESIRQAAGDARVLIDFQAIELKIGGVAISEGIKPIALINGRALGEGDLVSKDLVIGGIRSGEIEFVFRGLVLVRRF